jgi:hypothetical protein
METPFCPIALFKLIPVPLDFPTSWHSAERWTTLIFFHLNNH